jgi:hypothetical protein
MLTHDLRHRDLLFALARESWQVVDASSIAQRDEEARIQDYSRASGFVRLAQSRPWISRCLAIASDGHCFLLGTEWNLRLFDRTGTQCWQVIGPGVAWTITITLDGRTAIARLR